MAMIDYGALLRVDGNFINKDKDMFMEASDTGYICEKATYPSGNEYDINGNYFVYAGDKNFLVVFYKGSFKVISNEKILLSKWDVPFNSETFFFDGLPNLKVSRLSKYYEYEKLESWGTWQDFVREYWWGATGNEKPSELEGGTRAYKRYKKNLKRVARSKGYKTRPYRFIAEWDYNGHHYEVIFGYGIENVESVWNDIKDVYDFRQDEIEIIDGWFNE